jgi:molybdate transport system ATP-binding protein
MHWMIYGKTVCYSNEAVLRVVKELSVPKSGKRVAIFSNKTLDYYIEEEANHDVFALTQDTGRSLATLSSGEKKKALLTYLLKQKPECIILDNPFDNLDVETRSDLRARLNEFSASVQLLQIVRRFEDCLETIGNIVFLKDDEVVFKGEKSAFDVNQYHSEHPFPNKVPDAPYSYDLKSDELVVFNNVSVQYEGRPVLNHVNWQVKRGEFWQLKGPNGSGKTTILTMINGDNPKAFGQDIWLFGRKKGRGETVWDVKKNIGYFTPAMILRFRTSCTLEEMVISGLLDSIGLYQKVTDLQRDLAREWIDFIGLKQEADHNFVNASDIVQRLVLIARAMIKHPPLLILDEPTACLDDESSLFLSQLINRIASESSTAILFVSHRDESGLNPEQILTLTPGEGGSVATIQKVLLFN